VTRPRAAAAALALALVGDARAADAGSCRGGGSSSDSSSNDADASGSSTYVSVEVEPACVETSDVLGRRQCSGFGTWAMPAVLPRLAIELGTSVRSVGMSRIDAAGQIDHGIDGSYRYAMTGGEVGDEAAALGMDLRILGGRRLYGGVEASIGRIVGGDGPAMSTFGDDRLATATVDAPVHLHLGAGAVIGARAPVGRLTVSGELYTGARAFRTEVTSHHGACVTTDTSYDVELALEPRARIDLWLSPWLTLGGFAGTDLRARDVRVVGVTIGGHVRAFDGLR
jgi:hypothetical protein